MQRSVWAGGSGMVWVGARPAARWTAILLLDALGTAAALPVALWLRFDGRIPPQYLAALPRTLAILVAARLATNWAAALHRWSFRLSGLHEALRIAGAGAAGSMIFAALSLWLVP